MLGPQRRGQIVDMVERSGVIRIAEIVREFGVSRKTALRDLDLLDTEGLVDKVHGGAVAVVDSVSGARARSLEPARIRDQVRIGMVLPTRGHYNRAILRGVEAALGPAAARLVVVTTGWTRPDDVPKHLDRLTREGVDGILVRPTPARAMQSASNSHPWLAQSSIPTVLIEDELRPSEPSAAWSVATNDHRGVASAVHHLRMLGHRRISLITVGDAPRSPELQRLWHANLHDAGLDEDVPLIDGADFSSWPLPDPSALNAILQTLRSAEATAVICHNDVPARSLADHAKGVGYVIPGDLSLVAYEDRISTRASTPLTAVVLPGQEVGHVAAQSLLDLIDNPARPARQIRIDPELVIRQSTGSV